MIELPYINEIQVALFRLTEEDVEFAKDNLSRLEDETHLLNMPLGDTLTNISEAGRMAVLLAHYTRQHYEITTGALTLPESVNREDWLALLHVSMETASALCGICIRRAAIARGTRLPPDAFVGVVFHEGQFHAVASLDEEEEEDGVPRLPEVRAKQPN